MVMKKNRVLCIMLSLMLMVEPALQAAEPSTSANVSRFALVARLKKAYQNYKEAWSCMMKKGWGSCTEEQKERIGNSISVLMGIIAMTALGGALVQWEQQRKKDIKDLEHHIALKSQMPEGFSKEFLRVNNCYIGFSILQYQMRYGIDSDLRRIVDQLFQSEFSSGRFTDKKSYEDFISTFGLQDFYGQTKQPQKTHYDELRGIISANEELKGHFPQVFTFFNIQWWHVLGFAQKPTREQAREARTRVRTFVGSIHPDKHPENPRLYTEVSITVNKAYEEFKKFVGSTVQAHQAKPEKPLRDSGGID